MQQMEVYYSRYIDLYQYNPDDLPQVIYVFKRPLHRIRLFGKLFKVSTLVKNAPSRNTDL